MRNKKPIEKNIRENSRNSNEQEGVRQTDGGKRGEDDMVGRHGGPQMSACPPHHSLFPQRLSFLCLNRCPPVCCWLPQSVSDHLKD